MPVDSAVGVGVRQEDEAVSAVDEVGLAVTEVEGEADLAVGEEEGVDLVEVTVVEGAEVSVEGGVPVVGVADSAVDVVVDSVEDVDVADTKAVREQRCFDIFTSSYDIHGTPSVSLIPLLGILSRFSSHILSVYLC